MELKSIAKESIPKAIIRAKHYRLLNEPWQAESICRDILEIEPGHRLALLYLILSITDQFQFSTSKRSSGDEAKKLCALLEDEYEQKYYRGIIAERSGKAALQRSTPRAKYIAYDYYREAMKFYEEAEAIPSSENEGNEDTVLRWNACVRRIQEFKLKPSPDEHRSGMVFDY